MTVIGQVGRSAVTEETIEDVRELLSEAPYTSIRTGALQLEMSH